MSPIPETVAYYIIFFIIISLLVLVIYTVQKIHTARHRGKNLPKKNLYYAFVAKVFMKDLPD
ncbi:MAG: hypothetical protein CMC70_07115 [Flavobacteriaceae bacterium]|nr:hypothetical protein [Flavobacteriaceae bacterium]